MNESLKMHEKSLREWIQLISCLILKLKLKTRRHCSIFSNKNALQIQKLPWTVSNNKK